MEDFIEKTRKSISLTVPSGQRNAKRAFVVGFKYFDAAIAQKVTSDLTNVLMLENAAASITILDSASLPAPFFPNRRNIAFAGLLGGAILGASWAFLKGRKTPSGSGTPAAAPQ